MSVKISLIIPIYNVEKYLPECLDSCINQTLENIEIICINDCSPDNSLSIINEYKQRDTRIKLINHKTNMGLGAARNTGLKYAHGEYVWFVDSDDFIEKEACQLLYDTASKNHVDILLFQLKTFYDNLDKRIYIEDSYYNDLPKNKNLNLRIFNNFEGNIPVSACSYLSRRDFILHYNFRSGVYFEDTDFTPILLNEAENIRSITYSAYNRRITPGSITQTEMSEKKYRDKFEVVKALYKYISTHNIQKGSYIDKFSKGYSEYVFKEIQNSNFFTALSNEEEFKEIYKTTIKNNNHGINIIFLYLKKIVKYIIPYGVIILLRKIEYKISI